MVKVPVPDSGRKKMPFFSPKTRFNYQILGRDMPLMALKRLM